VVYSPSGGATGDAFFGGLLSVGEPSVVMKAVSGWTAATRVSDAFAKMGTIKALHRVAFTDGVTGDPTGTPGLAVLATVATKSGDVFVLSVNGSLQWESSLGGLTPAEVEAGEGALSLVAEVDVRSEVASAFEVVAVRFADLDSSSGRLPYTVYAEDGASGLEKVDGRTIEGLDAAPDGLFAVDRYTDADGVFWEAVVVGTADGDTIFVGPEGSASLSALPMPAVGNTWIAGHWSQQPGAPDTGLAPSAQKNGLKGKVLTSDGLEYDRTGAPSPVNLEVALAAWQDDGLEPALLATGGSPRTIRKQIDKSTPVLYAVGPAPGASGLADPADPILSLGDELLFGVTVEGGPFVVTRATHPDATYGEAAGVLAVVADGEDRVEFLSGGWLRTVTGGVEGAPVSFGIPHFRPVGSRKIGDRTLHVHHDATAKGVVLVIDSSGSITDADYTVELDSLSTAPTAEGGWQVVAHRGDGVAVLDLGLAEDVATLVGASAWSAVEGDDFGAGELFTGGLDTPPWASTSVPTAWTIEDSDPLAWLADREGTIFDLPPGELGDQLTFVVMPWTGTACPVATVAVLGAPGVLTAEDVTAISTSEEADCGDLLVPIGAADLFGLGQPSVLLVAVNNPTFVSAGTVFSSALRLVPLYTPPPLAEGAAIRVSGADWNGDGLDDLTVRFSSADGSESAALLLSDGEGGWIGGGSVLGQSALGNLAATPGAAPGWPQRAATVVGQTVLPELRR
jgi:hypothetical protein